MDSEKDPKSEASESTPAAGGVGGDAPSGESADEKRARMMAEIKAKAAARMAAKGTTPAKPETPAATPTTTPATTSATPPPAATTPATPASASGDAPEGETPEEKRARIIAEAKAKAAAKMAAKGSTTAGSESTPATTTAKVSDEATKELPAGTTPAARVAPGAAKASATPTASVARGIPAAVAARQHPTTVDTIAEPPINKMRRRIVWASVIGFLGTSLAMFLRFFLPRAIFEPSSIFRVGFPGDYGLGVDTKYQQQYRIWVTRTSDRLFVIYARCTHLGCTPDWKASENKFKCPCHGSGYDSEGINFEGPAPRPMDRAHVELDAEGQIVVNTGRLYDWPKGGDNKFNEPGAYIPL
ncbi:MAG TPA: Rieske 2Fe-2S domain-containing protein [Pyrinomonadaceae bacterium]|nr:Rieske 2Fe-2S domain-containing protein [Pyrinomonadaceae bacterium]